ncbi:MAG: D-alanyl-D-alanine carboxypeptidase [Bacteroidales bacterium]|nr:D-alanyl-D-alanine carboxypeptidase [Bacteroidales bacterium]
MRGEIPPDRDDFVLKASIPDPPLLAAVLLQEALESRGVEFEKQASSIRLSPSLADEYHNYPETVVMTSYSPPLSEIIRVTNTESVNMFAEQMLKYMGYVYTQGKAATVESGLEATGIFLEERLDDSGGIYMTDGSGLSRSNALSASFITSLLHYMKSSSRYPEHFFNSLSEAGKKGTLQYYFKDPVFRDRLKAKSGTSTRIRNYAGILTTREGTDVPFAVLVNNFDCSSSEVTERVERLLKNIINSPGSD